MRKELQQLDQELKSAKDAIILRRDFQMYGHNFLAEANAFMREVRKAATKCKKNELIILAVLI